MRSLEFHVASLGVLRQRGALLREDLSVCMPRSVGHALFVVLQRLVTLLLKLQCDWGTNVTVIFRRRCM